MTRQNAMRESHYLKFTVISAFIFKYGENNYIPNDENIGNHQEERPAICWRG